MDFKQDWDSAKVEENEQFDDSKFGRFQKKIWQLFDKPQSCLGARVQLMTYCVSMKSFSFR